MVKLTVDYYKQGEIIGGVQSFLDDFRHIYPDFKSISYRNAINSITGNMLDPKNFAYFEVEMSPIINQYIRKYEKIFKPDVIVKNSIVGTWKKYETPMICTLQDNNILGPEILHNNGYYNIHLFNRYRNVFTKLQEMTMKESVATVASSEHLKETYEKEFGIELELIKNGVDTEMFYPRNNKDALREKYGIPKDKKVGITVTGFLPIKGWHIQAKLCHDFPDIFWIIVFKHGKKEPKLKNVKIFEKLPREQMPEMYNMADFFVLPSAIEGCNVAAIEAMSSGLPIITANAGYFWKPEAKGNYEVADFGFRVNNWRYDCYKECLSDMLSGNYTFEPRKHVENNELDFKHWIGSWKKLIKEVMEK